MPESPTTARPLDLDDDDGQDSGVVNDSQSAASNTGAAAKEGKDGSNDRPTGAATPAADASEVPPPKPPRPMTEAQKNELILKEAFPSVDASVVKAVLRASGGQVEPAFHALLGP